MKIQRYAEDEKKKTVAPSYSPIVDAVMVARSLSMEDIAYAGDPIRGESCGFDALHDRFDANELLLDAELQIGPFPNYESCAPECRDANCKACLAAEEALDESGKRDTWVENASALMDQVTALIREMRRKLDEVLMDDELWFGFEEILSVATEHPDGTPIEDEIRDEHG